MEDSKQVYKEFGISINIYDWKQNLTGETIRESPPQFENRIMVRVYVRSITRSTMYQKASFC